MSVLRSLDESVSGVVHGLRLGALDWLLLVPAMAFSVTCLPLVLAAAAALLPRSTAAALLLGCLATVALTTVFKAAIARPRPSARALPPRCVDLRSREVNAAMPSGDTAQAGCLCTLLALSAAAAGGPGVGAGAAAAVAAALPPPWLAGALVVGATAFGRVYFGCHWAGDTIAGAALGCAVAAAVHASGAGAALAAAAVL